MCCRQYERYIEGRRLWQQIQSSTRTFARLTWFHAPNQLTEKPEEETKEAEAAKALLEKKVRVGLLQACQDQTLIRCLRL